jgi:hypothetical protein
MTDVQQNNSSNKPRDTKNDSTPREDEKMEKLLVEEKQPEDQLPVGEGHETEVIEENKE